MSGRLNAVQDKVGVAEENASCILRIGSLGFIPMFEAFFKRLLGECRTSHVHVQVCVCLPVLPAVCSFA